MESLYEMNAHLKIFTLPNRNTRIFGLLYKRKTWSKKERKAQILDQTCWTYQFVLLQVKSLQFTASSSKGHHAFICDTVALTQVDVFQLTAVLPQLKEKLLRIFKMEVKIFNWIILTYTFHLEIKRKKWDMLCKDLYTEMALNALPSLVLHLLVCPGCPHAPSPAEGSV